MGARSFFTRKTTIPKGLEPLLYQLLNDRGVCQGRDVTKVLHLAVGDLPENPPHNLAAPRLGQGIDDFDLARLGMCSQRVPYAVPNFLQEFWCVLEPFL